MCAQHYNLCVGKAPLGPLRSGSAWVQSNTLFTKYHQADRAKPTNPIKLLKRASPQKKSHCSKFLPCVPVAAEVGERRGLEDAEFPQSSGSLAQIGDERTWWHCRFLYKQEVVVAPEETLCIIGYCP